MLGSVSLRVLLILIWAFSAVVPAVAGTDPHRGLTDTESASDVARDNEA